jgi:hypothetical protein
MITANVAGSSGSHLRTDRGARESRSHSRQNLNDILESEVAAAEASLSKYKNGNRDMSDVRWTDIEAAEAKRLQELVDSYHRRRCLSDYKSWGPLVCVASVIIFAIVLVILAASGVLSTDEQ